MPQSSAHAIPTPAIQVSLELAAIRDDIRNRGMQAGRRLEAPRENRMEPVAERFRAAPIALLPHVRQQGQHGSIVKGHPMTCSVSGVDSNIQQSFQALRPVAHQVFEKPGFGGTSQTPC